MMKKRPKKPSINEILAGVFQETTTDPLGSYTGHPADEEDAPTQDGDDL